VVDLPDNTGEWLFVVLTVAAILIVGSLHVPWFDEQIRFAGPESVSTDDRLAIELDPHARWFAYDHKVLANETCSGPTNERRRNRTPNAIHEIAGR